MFAQFWNNLWAALEPGIGELSNTVIGVIVAILAALTAALGG